MSSARAPLPNESRGFSSSSSRSPVFPLPRTHYSKCVNSVLGQCSGARRPGPRRLAPTTKQRRTNERTNERTSGPNALINRRSRRARARGKTRKSQLSSSSQIVPSHHAVRRVQLVPHPGGDHRLRRARGDQRLRPHTLPAPGGPQPSMVPQARGGENMSARNVVSEPSLDLPLHRPYLNQPS